VQLQLPSSHLELSHRDYALIRIFADIYLAALTNSAASPSTAATTASTMASPAAESSSKPTAIRTATPSTLAFFANFAEGTFRIFS
jgi:hypothetical protein